MKRRRFFKAFAALAATVVVAPSVIAKLKPEKHFTEGLDFSQGLTEADFDTYLNEITKHAKSEDRILYCGDKFYQKLNRWAGNKISDHNVVGIRKTR